MKKYALLLLTLLLSFSMAHSEQNATNKSIFDLPTCPEGWSCDEWSNCSKGLETRFCFDENDCGTRNQMPIMMRNCTIPAAQETVDEKNTSNNSVKLQNTLQESPFNPIKNYLMIGIVIIAAIILAFFVYRKWSEKRAYSKLFVSEKQIEPEFQENSNSQLRNQSSEATQQQYSQQPEIEQKPFEQAQPQTELDAYVLKCRLAGHSRDQVKAKLTSAGWQEDAVESALIKYF